MTPEPTSDIFERLHREVIERIERYGYTATVVGSGECSVPGCTCGPEPYPYAYSIGLCEHGHPELVVFGLPRSHVNSAMDPVFAAARGRAPLAVGRQHRHEFEGGRVLSLVAVPELWARRDPGRIGGWIDVYRSALPPFLQICWADRDGLMPWEPGCDPAVRDLQPLLDDDPLRYPKPPRNSSRPRRRR
jgi:hypothetical protein